MIKLFCDRCEAEGGIISRVFPHDPIQLEVIARAPNHQQAHLCENCLAELLMASVETFKNSKVVTSYHSAFRTATELDQTLQELKDIKTERDDLLRRAIKADDTVVDLNKKLIRLEEQVELLARAADKAKADAQAEVKKRVAEIRQRVEDEKSAPEYVAAVERRERIRSSR